MRDRKPWTEEDLDRGGKPVFSQADLDFISNLVRGSAPLQQWRKDIFEKGPKRGHR